MSIDHFIDSLVAVWMLFGIPGGIRFVTQNRHVTEDRTTNFLIQLAAFLAGVLAGPTSMQKESSFTIRYNR